MGESRKRAVVENVVRAGMLAMAWAAATPAAFAQPEPTRAPAAGRSQAPAGGVDLSLDPQFDPAHDRCRRDRRPARGAALTNRYAGRLTWPQRLYQRHR